MRRRKLRWVVTALAVLLAALAVFLFGAWLGMPVTFHPDTSITRSDFRRIKVGMTAEQPREAPDLGRPVEDVARFVVGSEQGFHALAQVGVAGTGSVEEGGAFGRHRLVDGGEEDVPGILRFTGHGVLLSGVRRAMR